jgi:hypothetical protein
LNNWSQKRNESRILDILIYGVTIIILTPITTLLSSVYYKSQMLIFSKNSTLLFLHPSVVDLIIFYSPFTMAFLIIFSIRNTGYLSYLSYLRIMKIKFFSFIAIIIFIISVFILGFQFFKCTDINEEGICIKNSVFSENKNYGWSDVQYVNVSYNHEYKNKIELTYDIHLNDGTIVKARGSKGFFSNIINLDNFIKDKKINIIRSKIQPNDYKDFQNSFDPDTLQVVLEILDK